jgi:hypothetical protein
MGLVQGASFSVEEKGQTNHCQQQSKAIGDKDKEW